MHPPLRYPRVPEYRLLRPDAHRLAPRPRSGAIPSAKYDFKQDMINSGYWGYWWSGDVDMLSHGAERKLWVLEIIDHSRGRQVFDQGE